MSIHLLTFGVIWALVALFLAVMPLLSAQERKSIQVGAAKGYLLIIAIFGGLSLICFYGYWSIESGKTRKAEQGRQVQLEWERKEEAKRIAKESMPVGDETQVRSACLKGRDRVLAKIYVGMLINDLTVDDEFKIAGSKVIITVRLKMLTESAKELRKSGYIERKVKAGIPYAYKTAFEEAGLKEPVVVDLYDNPDLKKILANLKPQTNNSSAVTNGK